MFIVCVCSHCCDPVLMGLSPCVDACNRRIADTQGPTPLWLLLVLLLCELPRCAAAYTAVQSLYTASMENIGKGNAGDQFYRCTTPRLPLAYVIT